MSVGAFVAGMALAYKLGRSEESIDVSLQVEQGCTTRARHRFTENWLEAMFGPLLLTPKKTPVIVSTVDDSHYFNSPV